VLVGLGAWTLIAAEYEFGSVARIQTVVAPGDPNPMGGGFASADSPVLLRSSTVAFMGSSQGVFVHGPQGLSEIAISGDLSPGGQTFTTFGRQPFMSSNPSWVVFQARLDDGDDGIFLWDGNSVLAVAVEDGETWSGLNRNPAVNNLGHVAFIDHDSLVVWDGSFTTVATESDPNPCGGIFYRIPQGSSGGPSLNDSGSVAFGNRGTSSNVWGVFVWDGSSIIPIACAGDATPVGGTFDRFGERPIISNTGDVVFVGHRDPFYWELFLYSGGALSAIAEGYDVDDNLVVGVNASGDVAFVAGGGVFLYSGGSVTPVIGEGDPCPTGGSFGTIYPRSVSLSASGEVSFEAICAAGRGIFRSPVGGPATLLADQSTPTSVGTGFHFRHPIGTSASTVAFSGTRSGIIQARCRTSGCGDFETLVAAGDPVSDLPGQSVSSFSLLNGSKRAVVFEAFLSGGDEYGYGFFIHERRSVQKVALQEEALPEGEGEGWLYPAYFDSDDVPSQSVSRGRVAFLADVDHQSNYDFSHGIFVYRRGRLSTLARAGDPAPGGGTLGSFSSPSISGSRVVFAAGVDGSQMCILRFSLSGRQERLVCTGDPVPAPVNGTFDELRTPVASGSRAYFTAVLSESSSEECLFVHSGSRLDVLACLGDPLPGGGVIQEFSRDYPSSLLSASGSRIVTPVYDYSLDLSGYMVLRRGLATLVGFTGDPAPTPIGGTFSYWEGRASLQGKRVAFRADVTDGNKRSGIFLAKTRK
jgi:hypothetical protein